MADLKKNFENPPKGGNGRGVPTFNSMSSVPRPRASMDAVYQGDGKTQGSVVDGGGATIPQQRAEGMKMTGPGAQTTLRTSFEAGEAASRFNATQAGIVGQPEMRNFTRGGLHTQEAGDPSATGFYDYEQGGQGLNGRVGDGASAGPATPAQKPTPQINPDTTTDVRSDGKAANPMPGRLPYTAGGMADGVTRNNQRRR